QGRIVQTNVPSGVFGPFLNWPTSDWLGTTTFSEGGGFYPVKNKDDTSTLLYAPINQTGTYTLLLHSTLFGGKSATEPFSVSARFSTISEDDTPPKIQFTLPQYVNGTKSYVPEITDEGEFSVKYFLDDQEVTLTNSTISSAGQGLHHLKIEATDDAGNTSTQFYAFTIDTNPPEILIKSPANNTKVSDRITVDFAMEDENPDYSKTVISFEGVTIQNKTRVDLDLTNHTAGSHKIVIFAKDKASNTNQKVILFNIDRTQPVPAKTAFDLNLVLLIIAGIIVIAIASVVAITSRSKK
ncbi:MAG TPA: peptidase S8, partial [Candidatus Nitrosotenuis sp.]|nr:peptidase S8 [Candidatus Nitrosotenuis sp.]